MSFVSNKSMTNKELISVILPAYNAERYLSEAIDSVLNQTYTNFELIIINDGSTDKTEEIILSYLDPRIRYVKNEQNLKLIKTLNKGIDLAKGKYIARMDADDISLPTRLEKEVEFLEKHTDIDVVSCFPYNLNMKGKILGRSSYFVVTRPIPCKFVSMFEPSICHPACMFRADSIRKFKYSDNDKNLHIEAYELWNRMFHNESKGSMIPEYLIYYRDNASSVCHIHIDEQLSNHLYLLQKSLLDYLGIIIDTDTALCIMSKRDTKSIEIIDKAFLSLDLCQKAFVAKEKEISKEDLNEIWNWIEQRKAAILLTTILASSGVFRMRVIVKLLVNIKLLTKSNILKYIKNRIIRLKNEKK